MRLGFGIQGLSYQGATSEQPLLILPAGEMRTVPTNGMPVSMATTVNAGVANNTMQFTAQASVSVYALSLDKTFGYASSHSSASVNRTVTLFPVF